MTAAIRRCNQAASHGSNDCGNSTVVAVFRGAASIPSLLLANQLPGESKQLPGERKQATVQQALQLLTVPPTAQWSYFQNSSSCLPTRCPPSLEWCLWSIVCFGGVGCGVSSGQRAVKPGQTKRKRPESTGAALACLQSCPLFVRMVWSPSLPAQQ